MGIDLMLWGLVAICISWGIGAYNRITRVRARSFQSFSMVAKNVLRYQSLVTEHINPAEISGAPDAFQQLWQHLQTLDQLIQDVQACPWNADTLEILSAAMLETTHIWNQLRSAPADLAGAALPESLVIGWEANSRELIQSVRDFNQQLADYNEAIAQFPVAIVAVFMGFYPAGQMTLPNEN
jgi:LemA protein